jgi:hypothetical protein
MAPYLISHYFIPDACVLSFQSWGGSIRNGVRNVNVIIQDVVHTFRFFYRIRYEDDTMGCSYK